MHYAIIVTMQKLLLIQPVARNFYLFLDRVVVNQLFYLHYFFYD